MADRQRTVLVITRTDWHEPSRLRHQLSKLLASAGYSVFFVQKPACLLLPSRSPLICDSGVHNIHLLPSQELLHHQLRLVPWLHHLNGFLASRDLQQRLTSLGQINPSLIINFNYDAFWLRRLFPNATITTVINDDFEELGRLPFSGHLTWALARTCSMSDRVLAVSQPLLNRLSLWCKPELFLPWSGHPYSPPSIDLKRNVILFWGFINERIDQDAVFKALPGLRRAGFKLRFVGPLQPSGAEFRQQLQPESNVEWKHACTFEDLDTSDCLAALIPYRLNCPGVEAIQLSNKALQLLSRGLPLITSAMPNFHQADYVLPYGTSAYPTLIDAINVAASRFAALQPAIASFVAANGPQQRLAQLLGSRSAD